MAKDRFNLYYICLLSGLGNIPIQIIDNNTIMTLSMTLAKMVIIMILTMVTNIRL